MKLIWSPLALERLSEIAAYIAQDDQSAAEKWLQKVFAAVDRLRLFPQSGRAVPELGLKEFREIILDHYRIIYRQEAESVSVLTVRHCRQLLPVEDITSEDF